MPALTQSVQPQVRAFYFSWIRVVFLSSKMYYCFVSFGGLQLRASIIWTCNRGTMLTLYFSHVPVSVCLSVCHKSEFYRNGWTGRAGLAWRLPSTVPTVYYNEIQVSTEIRVLSSENLSLTLHLENFAISSYKRHVDCRKASSTKCRRMLSVINRTVVDQLSWQYLRRSTDCSSYWSSTSVYSTISSRGFICDSWYLRILFLLYGLQI